jgi:hypothetical protein
MKPSSLRITSPEKSSAFFTSPYSNSSTPPSRSRTHALSPIPDNSPVVSTSGATSPHSRTDSHTPLLPPSPAMLEKGQGAYPFPSARQGLGTRVRLAVGGKIGRGGIARRVVFITLILVLLLVLGKHATGGVRPLHAITNDPLWHEPELTTPARLLREGLRHLPVPPRPLPYRRRNLPNLHTG